MRECRTSALSAGFTFAAPLAVASLHPLEEIRAACEANRCGCYAKRWVCPPACGTLAECNARIAACDAGLIVQTVDMLTDGFDYEGMMQAQSHFHQLFRSFASELRMRVSSLLALGAGGCTICVRCAYPASPCRFPDRAVSSMEAYGLLVSDICRANGLAYGHGENTVTFTGCFLWKIDL